MQWERKTALLLKSPPPLLLYIILVLVVSKTETLRVERKERDGWMWDFKVLQQQQQHLRRIISWAFVYGALCGLAGLRWPYRKPSSHCSRGANREWKKICLWLQVTEQRRNTSHPGTICLLSHNRTCFWSHFPIWNLSFISILNLSQHSEINTVFWESMEHLQQSCCWLPAAEVCLEQMRRFMPSPCVADWTVSI